MPVKVAGSLPIDLPPDGWDMQKAQSQIAGFSRIDLSRAYYADGLKAPDGSLPQSRLPRLLR
jgi:hypothetical protein